MAATGQEGSSAESTDGDGVGGPPNSGVPWHDARSNVDSATVASAAAARALLSSKTSCIVMLPPGAVDTDTRKQIAAMVVASHHHTAAADGAAATTTTMATTLGTAGPLLEAKTTDAAAAATKTDAAHHLGAPGASRHRRGSAIERIRIMPDCHCGSGICVGFTCEMTRFGNPGLIGGDIGCGISALSLPRDFLSRRKNMLEKLDEVIQREVPMGFGKAHRGAVVNDRDWDAFLLEAQQLAAAFVVAYERKFGEPMPRAVPHYTLDYLRRRCEDSFGLNWDRLLCNVGTLGGGNHFFELDEDVRTSASHSSGVTGTTKPGQDDCGEKGGEGWSSSPLWLVVHSGSRCLGRAVYEYWSGRSGSAASPSGSHGPREGRRGDAAVGDDDDDDAENASVPTDFLLSGTDCADYYFDMILAQQFAVMNRAVMLSRVVHALGRLAVDTVPTKATSTAEGTAEECEGCDLDREAAVVASHNHRRRRQPSHSPRSGSRRRGDDEVGEESGSETDDSTSATDSDAGASPTSNSSAEDCPAVNRAAADNDNSSSRARGRHNEGVGNAVVDVGPTASSFSATLRHVTTRMVNTTHNYIDFRDLIVRKGAIRAAAGDRCIVALNMRDGILFCTGKGNPDWNHSAAHGCGRLVPRSTANAAALGFDDKQRQKRKGGKEMMRNQRDDSSVGRHRRGGPSATGTGGNPLLAKFAAEMQGVYTTCMTTATIDERPSCYKDVALIQAQLLPTVEIDRHCRTLLSCKGGGGT